jgi:hypothetical protein
MEGQLAAPNSRETRRDLHLRRPNGTFGRTLWRGVFLGPDYTTPIVLCEAQKGMLQLL